jgi:hypothetical protein
MADIRTHTDSWMEPKRGYMEDKKNNTAALRPAQLPGNAYGEGRGVAHGLGLDTSQIMNLNTQNA